MVRRICFGNHPLGIGGWVSQPGIDVLVANKWQMSWSTLFEQAQILQSGTVVCPDNEGVWSPLVPYPGLSYYPVIMFATDKFPMIVEHPTMSSFRCKKDEDWYMMADGGDQTCSYIILRTPRLA